MAEAGCLFGHRPLERGAIPMPRMKSFFIFCLVLIQAEIPWIVYPDTLSRYYHK